MQPFDKDYLERREKQIKELYELRATTWACLITGLILTGISLVLVSSGSQFLGSILFVVSLLFEVGAIFMFASYFAQKGADKAIEREREQLFALYGQKPKRGGSDGELRLSDDGDLIGEGLEEEDLIHGEGRRG